VLFAAIDVRRLPMAVSGCYNRSAGEFIMAVAFPENFRPLKRVEYDKLVELGVFGEERIELINGWLVPMNPPKPPHADAVDELTEILVRALAGVARVRVQNPFAAGDISEPQPDVVVVPRERYNVEHPASAHLVIEVAESSLKYDRGTKLRLYAEQNVPEYWIVDVVARRIEVYREQASGEFASKGVFERGEAIQLLRFPAVTVRVSDVFG
jgi:Uma2 family endonuclease